LPGLDRRILRAIDHESVIDRIKLDIRSDFILAPHFNAIFVSAGDELWTRLEEKLRSGSYSPGLPLTISVPKERGFTRPGSILQPFDRFVYHALVDSVSPTLEKALDRERAFSNVVSSEPGELFSSTQLAWEQFQKKIAAISDGGSYILKADIASYFERIPQHHLINLMSSTGCPGEAVNLLEEMLLAFQERNSFGIVQGVYPSDVLGNFFLSEFDAFCELQSIPSARYVDDIYMAFGSEAEAKKGLVDLIERLRKNGLHLNEYKSGIFPSRQVVRDETAIDRMFTIVRDGVQDEVYSTMSSAYAFEADWEIDDEDEDYDEDEEVASDEERIESAAVERLFDETKRRPKYSDRIEKFTLPLLRQAESDVAIDHVLKNLVKKPHQTRLYYSYLSGFVKHDNELVTALEKIARSQELTSDFQRMYLLAALLKAPEIGKATVNVALTWLKNRQIPQEVRAIAAIFASRHGNANQKRTVRLEYEHEPSQYVRGAILYASRYLTSAEKKTCKKAWGAHSTENALIAQTI
jgi:Reverse transcriptase (RNA-dependent DNA polymerase)